MRLRAAVLSCTLLAVLVLTAPPADAAETPAAPAPKLGFVGRAKPVLRMEDGGSFATVTVAVANSGDADAEAVTFGLLEDDKAPVAACRVVELTDTSTTAAAGSCDSSPPPLTLASGATARYAVTFPIPPSARPRDALVEARTSAAKVAPALVEVQVARSLPAERLWWPLWAAAAAAAALLLVGAIATRRAANRVPPNTKGFWAWSRANIYTEAAWSAKDSWATNVAAIGGVLGTVLGATGFFTEVLPGVSAGRFTGYSLLFGGLGVLSPIVYSAFGGRDQTLKITTGTVAGLLLAGAVTVGAVAGEMATLGLLVGMSDASSEFQWLCVVGMAIAGLLVVVYAVRSAAWLSAQPAPTPATGGSEGAAVVVSLKRAAAPSGYGVTSAGVP